MNVRPPIVKPLPDPTIRPRPCLECQGEIFWRYLGKDRLHCATCAPCPDAKTAAWYFAELEDTERAA